MAIRELLESISERIQIRASIKTMYGEPFKAEGKTMIPVGRVRYFFWGVGRGSETDGDTDIEEAPPGPKGSERGGGGGGAMVSPVGVVEITPGETRFISFEEKRKIVGALVVGVVFGMFLMRRRR